MKSTVRYFWNTIKAMDNPQTPNSSPEWERRTLEKLAFAALDEQKSRRRWGIFFKAIGFIYLLVVLFAVVDWGSDTEHQERHTAMVSLNGVIQSKGEANAEKLMAALQSAFEEKNSVGVVLQPSSRFSAGTLDPRADGGCAPQPSPDWTCRMQDLQISLHMRRTTSH